MAEKNNSNKMITIALIAIICLAAMILLYVNLPDSEKTSDDINENIDEETVEKPIVNLSIIYDDQSITYSFDEIESMQSETGTSRYLKASPFFKDGQIIIKPDINESANQYTGVKITKLIENIEKLPDNYNVTISAPDGFDTTLSKEQVEGNMTVYNETGVESYADVIPILAYKQGSDYLDEEDGVLMVAIIGEEPITLSNIWVSNVVKIEITD